MNTNEISGKRQLEFLADFDYIREAGTAGEEKAAERIQKTLDSFGVESHLEEFSFDTFQIKKAKLKVTEPYTKEYTVTGYGRCGKQQRTGWKHHLRMQRTVMISALHMSAERLLW